MHGSEVGDFSSSAASVLWACTGGRSLAKYSWLVTDQRYRMDDPRRSVSKNRPCALACDVKVILTELYLVAWRGKKWTNSPAQGDPCNTSPPSEWRDLWGFGTYRIRRPYADLPASFQYLGNQGVTFLGTHAQSCFYNNRSVRSEIRTRVLDDVECEDRDVAYTEL